MVITTSKLTSICRLCKNESLFRRGLYPHQKGWCYEKEVVYSYFCGTIYNRRSFLSGRLFLGNVPIASKLLGTNKPRDLGVKISIPSAYQGLNDLKKPVTPQDVQAILKNPKSYQTVKATITQEEASSLLAVGDIPDFHLE